MLTYVLIGLAGALGTLARFWLGNAMVALAGASFPWGTVLINVLGSFVIGWFGTLTATDGRFAATPELRALVMVGLCGGFTTFSSFSLQTLELLRDGRTGAALANIALSVGLCLASVTLGQAAAVAMRSSRLATVGPAPAHGIGDSMLVALHRPESVTGMLSTAASLLTLGDGGRVTALAIDAPRLAQLQPTEEVVTRERRAQLATQRAEWSRTMRAKLESWVRDERGKGIEARWVEVRGDAATALIEHGRSSHLLLLEHAPDEPAAQALLHAALYRSGRPVLLLPPSPAPRIGRIVAIAWRDDPHVRLAVRSVAGLLARAERVVVLRIDASGEERSIPPKLRGRPAELVTGSSEHGNVGTKLLSCARDAGADLLVMGSHGHGRLQEQLFDGVTETVLAQASLPVLLQHRLVI